MKTPLEMYEEYCKAYNLKPTPLKTKTFSTIEVTEIKEPKKMSGKKKAEPNAEVIDPKEHKVAEIPQVKQMVDAIEKEKAAKRFILLDRDLVEKMAEQLKMIEDVDNKTDIESIADLLEAV